MRNRNGFINFLRGHKTNGSKKDIYGKVIRKIKPEDVKIQKPVEIAVDPRDTYFEGTIDGTKQFIARFTDNSDERLKAPKIVSIFWLNGNLESLTIYGDNITYSNFEGWNHITSDYEKKFSAELSNTMELLGFNVLYSSNGRTRSGTTYGDLYRITGMKEPIIPRLTEEVYEYCKGIIEREKVQENHDNIQFGE